MKKGIDADVDLRSHATAIKAAGIDFAERYSKNTSKIEIQALSDAGIDTVIIFESTATRALGGATAGAYDGQNARQFMISIGAPPGSAVYFTVDDDVGAGQIGAVQAYYPAAQQGLGKPYRAGLYASGYVLREANPTLPWLAGAMGWQGSRSYTSAVQQQGPDLEGMAKLWNGIQWPALGFDYDPDVSLADDFGQFNLNHAQPIPPPVKPPVPVDASDPVSVILAAASFTQAVEAFQSKAGLAVDGVIGQHTLRALWGK